MLQADTGKNEARQQPSRRNTGARQPVSRVLSASIHQYMETGSRPGPRTGAVTSSLSVRDCETLPYFKDHCRRISALLSSEQTSTLARSSMLVSTRLAAARDLPMEVNCTQHGRQAVWPANGSYEYIVHLSIRPKSWGPVASMACVAGMKGATKTSLACRTCAGLATTDSQEETGKEYR